jgi:hypothetical protein
VGRALHVSDLVLLDGVDVLESPTLSVATVTALKEEVVEEEEAPEVESAEPEVIGEEKGEGEEASGA